MSNRKQISQTNSLKLMNPNPPKQKTSFNLSLNKLHNPHKCDLEKSFRIDLEDSKLLSKSKHWILKLTFLETSSKELRISKLNVTSLKNSHRCFSNRIKTSSKLHAQFVFQNISMEMYWKFFQCVIMPFMLNASKNGFQNTKVVHFAECNFILIISEKILEKQSSLKN